MRLHIIAIGKGGSNDPLHRLAGDWFGRIDARNRGRIEIKPAKNPADESAAIIKSIPDDGVLVALDAKGENTSSTALADMIRESRDDGIRDMVFAIGGADGHHESLLARANAIIAFGHATWPHMLCRAMLAEQLYRAEMIIKGHPYHHG